MPAAAAGFLIFRRHDEDEICSQFFVLHFTLFPRQGDVSWRCQYLLSSRLLTEEMSFILIKRLMRSSLIPPPYD